MGGVAKSRVDDNNEEEFWEGAQQTSDHNGLVVDLRSKAIDKLIDHRRNFKLAVGMYGKMAGDNC